MQGPKNSRFSDAHFLAIMVENGPSKADIIAQLFGTFFELFGKVCLRRCQTPKIMKKSYDFSKIFDQFSAYTHVLQRADCEGCGDDPP